MVAQAGGADVGKRAWGLSTCAVDVEVVAGVRWKRAAVGKPVKVVASVVGVDVASGVVMVGVVMDGGVDGVVADVVRVRSGAGARWDRGKACV